VVISFDFWTTCDLDSSDNFADNNFTQKQKKVDVLQQSL
jgi:hypothetical protein